MKRERPAVLAEALLHLSVLRCGPIAIAPSAHDVEAFERKPRRIHLAMADRAAFAGTMLVELLANSDRAADIRIDGPDRRRRRWRVHAHDALAHPFAAKDRR